MDLSLWLRPMSPVVDGHVRVRGLLVGRRSDGTPVLPDIDDVVRVPSWVRDVEILVPHIAGSVAGRDDFGLNPAPVPSGSWTPWAARGDLREHTDDHSKVVASLLLEPDAHANALRMLDALYRGDALRGDGLQDPRSDLVHAVAAMLGPPEAENEIALAPLVAITGLVFHARVEVKRLNAATPPPPDPPQPGLLTVTRVIPDRPTDGDVFPDGVVTDLPMQVVQGVDGFTLTLVQAPQRPLELPSAEGWQVRMRRWIGPVRTGTPVVDQISSGRPDPRVHAIDRMGPEDLVGRQLSWSVEVRNEHGRLCFRGLAAAVRERLDPPPPVTSAEVTFTSSTGTVQLTLRDLPDLDRQGPLHVVLFTQRRALDACGFYGDADDLALLEGLRALDLSGEATLDGAAQLLDKMPDEPGDADMQAWRRAVEVAAGPARFGRQGLDRVPLDLEIHSPMTTATVAVDLGSAFTSGHGLRFYAALARDADEARVMSSVSPCRHFVAPSPGTTPIEVFQIEKPSAPKARCFLRARPEARKFDPAVSAEEIDKPGAPSAVKLRWRHPALRAQPQPSDVEEWRKQVVSVRASPPVPLGGYRLWVRDLLAPGDPTPYACAGELQALPAFTAALRPLPAPAARGWRATPARPSTPPAQPVRKLDDLFEHPTPAPGDKRVSGKQLEAVTAAWKAVTAALGGAAPTAANLLERASSDIRAATALRELQGSVLVMLDAAGFMTRLRARLAWVGELIAAPTRWRKHVEDALVEYPTYFLLFPRDPEGHPYATHLAIEDPLIAGAFEGLDPEAKARASDAWSLFVATTFGTAPSGAGRLAYLQEVPEGPRTSTWDARRRLSFTWEGLHDLWHHELEWVVEVRDRYARLREQATYDVAPSLEIEDVPPEAVLPVSVRRRVPVLERVAVVPELIRAASGVEEAWIAFRLLPPPAWQHSTHNVLNRTRLGRLSLDFETRWELPRVAVWTKMLGARASGRSWAEVASGQPKDWEEPRVTSTGTPDPRVPFYQELVPPPTPGEGPVRVGTSLVGMPAVPYYLRVHLGAWLVADNLAGPHTWAATERPPRGLGLLRRPRWDVSEVDGGHFQIELGIVTPLLGCHLDELERPEAGWVERDDLEPPARLSNLGETGVPDVELALLPDLRLQIQFFLDLGTPTLPLLVPIAVWQGPLTDEPDADPAGEPDTFGFRCAVRATRWLRQLSVTSQEDGLVTRLLLGTNDDIPTEVRGALAKARDVPSTRLLAAQLRRGPRTTRPFYLPHRQDTVPG